MTELSRILYVEDQADIQIVARAALESVGGFELVICDSGEQALQQVANFLPQLLLLDVMMPGMDGPTTLKEMRKIQALVDTPAIFMTAKVQPCEVDELLSYGAIDVITKPFDPMTLADEIRVCWNKV